VSTDLRSSASAQRPPTTRPSANGRRPVQIISLESYIIYSRSGFTLLELLVVVAILAVIAGLLLPVLHRAQAKAQGINCLNNLRQMQMAWQMYTDDHAGWVPENQAELYRGIWRSTPNSWTGPSSAPFDPDTFAIEYGSLYRGGYARSLRLFRCPSDDSRVRKPEGGELDLDRTRSYAMNGNFGGREQETQQVFRREQVVFNPSAVFVFIDEDERSIDDGHFLVWPAPDNRWVNMPTDRHRRGATLSFADGHVELWRWEWRKRFAMRVQYWFPAENQADLRDLRRLQAAVVKPEKVKR
jgi:prepilin-type N-terminal cleavage/methylation domain-containing protein/prepilin-type processing-associated H-X9-DG protein